MNNSPTLRSSYSLKAIHLLPGEHGKILGETRGGVGKSGVLEHKSGGSISETRIKIEEKELTNALSNGTIPTPYGLLFPKIGGSQPPKVQSLLSQVRVKIRTSNFVLTFKRSIGTKAIIISGKIALGLSKIFRAPMYTSRGHLCSSSAFLFHYSLRYSKYQLTRIG